MYKISGSTTKRNEKYQQSKGRDGGGGMRGQVKQPNSAQEPTSTPPSLSLEVTPNCSAFTFHL